MNFIGLLYDRIRWDEKALINASKKANVAIKPIDCKKIYIDLEDSGDIEKRLGSVVLQRCVSHFRGLHVASILESMGLSVINPFQVSLVCGNKLYTTLALIKAGVPTPKTMMAFDPEAALEALDAMGYPAVLKPVVGSWGRLVSIVKDRESAEAIIEAREEIRNSLLQIYYVQKFVERPPRDIRVLVIGDEVVAASYRYSSKGEWRTNVARGGVSKPCPMTPELEDVSIKASKAVNGGVVAVDCMEGPDGLLVHEVNSTVEFRGLSSTTNIDIAGKIIEYVVEAAKR